LNKGYHLITHTGSATERALWLDKSRMFRNTSGMGSVSIRDLFVGVVSSLSLTSGLKVQAIALYDRTLTDEEIATAYDVIAARATVAPTTTTRVTAWEGDSITAASGSQAYLYGATAADSQIGAVWALNGATLADLVTRGPELDKAVADTASKCVLNVLIGANDLKSYGTGAAGYITDLAAYCDDRRTAGWEVVVGTILPQTDATHNTRRATVNAAIATWVGVHCDAIADFAANTTIGEDADASNVTYYSDGLHPTAAGYAIMEPISTAANDSL
jgi:lysophospholipase L1-like esterase